MPDFIAIQSEVIALIEALDLQFMSLSDSDYDEIRYIELT